MNENDDQSPEFVNAEELKPCLRSPTEDKFREVANKIREDLGLSGQKRVVTKQITALLLNVVDREKHHPGGFLRCSRDNNHWAELNSKRLNNSDDEDNDPNPWGLSTKLNEIVDVLAEKSFIERNLGSVGDHFKGKPSLQTRIKPTQALIDKYIKPSGLLDATIEDHEEFPVLRVKETFHKDKPQEFHVRSVPEGHPQMKGRIKKYNALLKKTDIRLAEVPETKETIPRINFDRQKQVYRSFNDKALKLGGRFYGPWWMGGPEGVKSYQRKHILINGKPTVELDYKAQHAHLLYGTRLKKHLDTFIKGDPYAIPGAVTYPRKLGKLVFTTALNIAGRGYLRGSVLKSLNEEAESTDTVKVAAAKDALQYVEDKDKFNKFREDFEWFHSNVEDHFYEDNWKPFMKMDSDICAYIIDEMTKEGIPVLSVHDSFIVEKEHEATLRQVMTDAYVKRGLATSLPPIEAK